jgi:imidazolonepropionase-like amidohydrolase
MPHVLACLLMAAIPASPLAQDEKPLPPPRDQVLLQQVRIWEGNSAAAERREDLLFRRSQPVLRGTIAAADWPEAHVVAAEEDWILYPARFHAEYAAKLLEAPANAFRSAQTDTGAEPIIEMEYGNRAAFAAHLRAADLLEWKDDEGKDWREVGFTRVQVLPRQGLLQGRAAVAALSALPLGDALLLRDGVELRSLRTGAGGYPSTPMGALAVHRQLMTDAALRGAAGAAARPAPDLNLGERPMWRARSAREIENLLDLMQDAPRGWTLLGGREAWMHAERLLAADVAVLYVLDLDAAPKSEEDLKYDDAEGRRWWQDPLALREERRREHAETVGDFLKVRAAGIRCALVPGGNVKSLGEDIKQLLDAGADADDLHRAMSTDPARVLGLPESDDAIVSRGALRLDEPALAWAFADGRGFEYPKKEQQEKKEEAKDGEDAEQDAEEPEKVPDSSALAGDWEITADTPMGEQTFGTGFDPANQEVEVFDSEDPGEREPARNVHFEGHTVRFDFTVPDMDLEVSVTLSLEGEALAGTIVSPWGDLPITGKRIAAGPEEAEEQPAAEAAGAAEPKPGEPRLGHPQWPVERKADRDPPSAWARARSGSLLLLGGTLHRMDGSAPETGDLLIRDGVIVEIGRSVIAPEDVEAVDANGWHVMPAVLDAHSHLALDSVNEGTLAITAECRIADMIHPGDVGIWRAAAGGTAVAQALHGSANPIGGQAAAWELDYFATRIADLLHPARPQNIKFALGENVRQSNDGGTATRFPTSRLGVEAVYRRAFTAAQDYAARRARAEPGFRRDERLEVLAGILANKVKIQCHSYRADEIQMFLRICREFGITEPTFQHVLEGYKLAPELAAFGAMASTFSDWWAYKYEVKDAIPWNVEILHKAGVVVSINSDSDEMIRRLNTEAAKAMRYGGLTYSEAMATCTLNSARQMHLGDRLGTLEPGKDGTLAVYDAPPLSGAAQCVLTLARGRVLYERNPEHDVRWRQYAASAREFAAAGRAEAAEPAPAALAADGWEPWTRLGQGQAWIVSGARIHDMVHPPFAGALVVRDGRVVAVTRAGEPLPALPDAVQVDAQGLDLYPGFLNCGDVTGLFEIGAIRSARDDSELGDFQPDLIAGAAIHADSPHIAVTRTNGVAYVLVTPDGGTIRSQASLIQLAGTTSEDLVVVPRVGLMIEFPHAGKVDPKKGPEEPKELAALDRRFDEALAYHERSERARAAGHSLAERDTRLAAIVPYARGEMPLLIEAADAPTLMFARAWVTRRGMQAIWMGARDAWKVAGFLGEERARVIFGPVHALPSAESDPFDVPFRLPWLLRETGCRVALRTADPELTRNLPYQAATASAFGLGPEATLRMLTLGAAEVLGVDAHVGSIEAGKVATFFLCAGDPLDFGVVQRMWIGGAEVPLTSHQSELRDRYLGRLTPR